jgi:amidase
MRDGSLDRRALFRVGAGAALALANRQRPVAARTSTRFTPPPHRPLDFRPFEDALAHYSADRRCTLGPLILEATAPQLQLDLDAGRYSAADLVTFYIDRIRRIDAGRLRAVLELNPDALEIAAALDAERAAGRVRGPLHGVPVLIKDNIGTGGRMHTTAGAAALGAARCDRDAQLVALLREAGALILGKANLSEWSYWMSYVAPSGYSALGGQVVCPYGEGIDPVGSSTGSAVAATANLAAVTVGTETAGSIVAPSSRASVVGMRPSLGLITRDRVLPITDECDSAGPIGRTVTDIAVMMTAMAAKRDPRDRQSHRAEGVHGTDFMAALDPHALRGKRIGVIGIEYDGAASDDWVIANSGLTDVVRAMEAAGGKVIVVRPAPFDYTGPGFVPEFNWGQREGVDAYLAATGAPVRTLADVIAFNEEDPARFAPWGQDRLRDSLWSPLGEREARQIARDNRQQAREYLSGLLDGDDLDLLVGIDTLQSLIYPFAGFPAIAVPAGLSAWGAPFAVTFIGRPRSDAALIGMAFAFEQASRFRVPPDLTPFDGGCMTVSRHVHGAGRWSRGLAPSETATEAAMP